MKVITIPKSPVYPPAMDWQSLRGEGIRHIERLGSAIWSDYNTHDPGITTLEVLCYALTDLGYRIHSIEDKDLFAATPGKKAFHSAAEILTNAPVTALDLRKIIIDIDGVKNAWLVSGESDLVTNFKNDSNYKPKIDFQKHLGKYEPILSNLDNGSKKNKIENILFSISTPENSLNKCDKAEIKKVENAFLLSVFDLFLTAINRNINVNRALVLYLIENELFNFKDFTLEQNLNPVNVDQILRTIKEKLKEQGSNLEPNEVNFIDRAYLSVEKKPLKIDYAKIIFEKFFPKDLFKFVPKPASYYNVYKLRGVYDILVELEEERKPEEHLIEKEICKRLHANRPLCEDFGSIKFLDKEPLGVCANIEIESDVDPIKIQAAIYDAIEEFMTPTIRFYSLEERMNHFATFWINAHVIDALRETMLPTDLILNLELIENKHFISDSVFLNELKSKIGDTYFEEYGNLIFEKAERQYDSDPVYQGPLLEHGFVDDVELQKSQLRNVVYKSDLFTVISNVKGVKKIQHLSIRKCEEGAPNNDTWCVPFDCECVPFLDIDCSKFRFSKGVDFFEISDKWEVMSQLEMLRASRTKIKQAAMDLPISHGEYLPELNEFTSIQMDFPRNYQIGKTYKKQTESLERKAKAKQLQGFLLFFDQILANYLAQLGQVREMFAIEPSETPLSLYQMLTNVPAFTDLAKMPEFEKTLSNLTNGTALQKLMRENKVLDHLLARFGEQFTDYVLQLYRIEKPIVDTDDAEGGLAEWVNDKRRFLQSLPLLRANRSLGFNYQPEIFDNNTHFWNSGNVEGVKRTVCAQLGMNDDSRRTISSEPKFDIEIRQKSIRGQKRYYIILLDDSGEILLEGQSLFASENAAEKEKDAMLEDLASADNYEILNDVNVCFWKKEVVKANRNIDNVLLKKTFNTNEKATEHFNVIKKLIDNGCETDNFHLIEHILLRPENENYAILNTTNNISSFQHLDPYSFQITCFVPDWASRFDDAKRFYHFDQTLRSEMSAHVELSIKKLSKADMLEFEILYHTWLSLKISHGEDEFEIKQANDKLVEFLNKHEYVANGHHQIKIPNCK